MYNHQTLKAEYPQHQEVLLFYKTTPCPTLHQDTDLHKQSPKKTCFQVPCYHYHSIQDMRRPALDEGTDSLLYDAVYCPSLQEGYECPDGMSCGFCHTHVEFNYHPLYYKTEPCTNCMCPTNQKLCPYYHPEESDRNPLIEKIMLATNSENSAYNDGKTKPNQFNLDLFKVKPCIKKGNHNVKICDYYHHDKDRRRPSNIFSYVPPICSYILRNLVCPNGDNCRYAHNKLEQLYHPERYKRKFCLHHPHNIHKCEYGGHCSFAHNENEIKVELLHNMKQDEHFYVNKYKTVFCPYIYEHDRTQCIYAHNPQDLRRDPAQYKYNAAQCMYWSLGQIFCYEDGGCPNQMDCPNCHGWKELEYHPLSYKTKPCTNTKKCNKKECPFYHTNADRRQMRVTSSLTKSLLNGPSKPFTQQGMFGPGANQTFNEDHGRMMENNKMNNNYLQSNSPIFTPFRMCESENSKRSESKLNRHGGFSQATTTHSSSANYIEDDMTPLSYKPRGQMNDMHSGFKNSVKVASASPDMNKFAFGKSLFSQQNEPWSSFQPDQEDQMENFFPSGSNSLKNSKPNVIEKDKDSNDSLDNDGKGLTRKTSEMSNNEFKEALVSNLDKKGLSHVKQFLINPMIDVKALKSFSQKDFPLFPQIAIPDKEKIVRIIQDILEVDALLCDVNVLSGDDCPLSALSDEAEFFKCIGSWEKNQDLKGFGGLLMDSQH